MQIKTTVQYHLTLVRKAIFKRLQIMSARGGMEKGNPPAQPVGMSIAITTMENSMKVL